MKHSKGITKKSYTFFYFSLEIKKNMYIFVETFKYKHNEY
jgi:hypothetical protein